MSEDIAPHAKLGFANNGEIILLALEVEKLRGELATYKEALHKAAERECRRDDSMMYKLPQAIEETVQRWLTQPNTQANKTQEPFKPSNKPNH